MILREILWIIGNGKVNDRVVINLKEVKRMCRSLKWINKVYCKVWYGSIYL